MKLSYFLEIFLQQMKLSYFLEIFLQQSYMHVSSLQWA